MKDVLKSLAKSVLIPLGLIATADESESIWLGILGTSVLWNILVNKGATAKD